MDALTFEALAATGCIGIGIAVRHRASTARSTVVPPTPRSIGRLRRRHRRIAREIVAVAHECLERHPNGSFEAFTAREALRSYLPETLAAYFAVPPTLRRTRRARSSADEELSSQLRTIYSGLERLREAEAEIGVTRMAANRAFLDERFGPPDPPRLGSQAFSLLREVADLVGSAVRRA